MRMKYRIGSISGSCEETEIVVGVGGNRLLAGIIVLILLLAPFSTVAAVEAPPSEASEEAAKGDGKKPAAGGGKDGAAGKDGDENRQDADEKPKDETTFSSKLDYVAKHVSLATGAVVLNPFTIENGATPADKTLDDDDVSANAIIEAGFRRRWAWDSWESLELAKARKELADLKEQRKKLEATLAAGAAAKSGAGDGKNQPTAAEKALEGARNLELDELNKVIAEKIKAVAAAEASAKGVNRTSGFLRELIGPDDNLPLSDKKAGNHPYQRFFANAAAAAAPTNYTVRLGFALGEDSNRNAASVAGSGDFYTEVGLGWDIFRGYVRSESVPLKISFGPEVHASFNGDGGRDSFRQRILAGGAMSVGAPVGADDGRIVEVVVRAGWVRVDAPQFLNSADRTLLVRNEQAEFRKEQGFGLDVEFNIPITETLGYVFLRAATNHGINPDPWATTIGWTIPINNLGSTLGLGD